MVDDWPLSVVWMTLSWMLPYCHHNFHIASPRFGANAASDRSWRTYSTPDHLYWVMFRELERKLRSIVKKHLFGLAGTNWVKQRVPP